MFGLSSLWFVGLWHILANYSLGFLIVVGLLVFAVVSPILKRTALTLAVAVACCLFAYSLGIRDEGDRVREQWRESLRLETKNGEKSRSDAERVIAHDTPDVVRNDPRNRDNWGSGRSSGTGSKVRRLARP
jgi:hypothetical protein